MADIQASKVEEIVRLSGNDKFDRIARRFRIAFGGAIVGSCVMSILGSFIGHDTTILELGGAAIGFIAVYPIVDRHMAGDL